jgi:porin
LLDVQVTLDFEKMNSSLPGQFFLLAQNSHGQGLTEDFVGDTQVLSNIDSFNNIMHVGEYWWEFCLRDSDMKVRVGKQDVNTEFLYMDTSADFVHSTFGLTPSAVLPTYPSQSMAAVLFAQINDSLQLKVGVWDALARGGNWGFSGNSTVLAVGELEYRYAVFDDTLPGTFSVGAGYFSAGEVSGQPLDAIHAYSVQLEQFIYREHTCAADDQQGLAAFAGYYPRFEGDQVLIESIGDSFVVGAVYEGLLPQRDHDRLGVGISWAELHQGGTNQETAVEVFYKAQMSPRFSIQPDLQYIATPSGIHSDALVAGVRCQLAF